MGTGTKALSHTVSLTHSNLMSYKRFFAMIITSTVVMYGLMYSNTYEWSHVWWSQTRFWMALYMGAVMAIIMLGFMLKMYENQKANIAIFGGSALLIVASLFLVRSQATVGDVSWMKAMIPHHSIAILTSERANISDPRVRRLADDIILAQRREIAEMEAIIADIEGGDYAGGEPIPPSVPPVEGGDVAVEGAPSLTVGTGALWGRVLIVESVKVTSDAWLVVHPEAAGGGPDAATVLGKAFVLHGATERIPVALDDEALVEAPLYVMLHDDTGQIGVFEFQPGGTTDLPLVQDGQPVMQRVP